MHAAHAYFITRISYGSHCEKMYLQTIFTVIKKAQKLRIAFLLKKTLNLIEIAKVLLQ